MWNGRNIGAFLRDILWKGYHGLRVRSAVAFALALVWWVVLYPELCFADGTCVEVSVQDGQKIEAGYADYRDVMGAEGDEIVLESRLLEWLEQKINKE